jgi:hypothetical protein
MILRTRRLPKWLPRLPWSEEFQLPSLPSLNLSCLFSLHLTCYNLTFNSSIPWLRPISFLFLTRLPTTYLISRILHSYITSFYATLLLFHSIWQSLSWDGTSSETLLKWSILMTTRVPYYLTYLKDSTQTWSKGWSISMICQLIMTKTSPLP